MITLKKLRFSLLLLFLLLFIPTPVLAGVNGDGSHNPATGNGSPGAADVWCWQEWVGLRVSFVEEATGDMVGNSFDFYRIDKSNHSFDFNNCTWYGLTKLEIMNDRDWQHDIGDEMHTSGYLSRAQQNTGIPMFIPNMDSDKIPACDVDVLKKYVNEHIYQFSGKCNARSTLLRAEDVFPVYVNNGKETVYAADENGYCAIQKEYVMVVEPILYYHVGDEFLAITPTEFGVLYKTAKNPNEVFRGKETLLKYNFPRSMYLEHTELKLGIEKPTTSQLATNHLYTPDERINIMGVWTVRSNYETKYKYMWRYYYKGPEGSGQPTNWELDDSLEMSKIADLGFKVRTANWERGMKENFVGNDGKQYHWEFKNIKWGYGDNRKFEGLDTLDTGYMTVTKKLSENSISLWYEAVPNGGTPYTIEFWYKDGKADEPGEWRRGTGLGDVTQYYGEIGKIIDYAAPFSKNGYTWHHTLFGDDPDAANLKLTGDPDRDVIRVFFSVLIEFVSPM